MPRTRRSKSPAKRRSAEKGSSASKSKAKKGRSRSRSKSKPKAAKKSRSKSASKKDAKTKPKKSKAKAKKSKAKSEDEDGVHWPFTEAEMEWKVKSFSRGIVLCGIYHAVFFYGATLQPSTALAMQASTERVAFSLAGLLLIWWTTFWGAYPFYYGAPPPKKTDRKYDVINKCPFGFGTYLTNNILFAITAYFFCFAVAEISLYRGQPLWQAMHLTLALAKPVCTMAIVLFLL